MKTFMRIPVILGMMLTFPTSVYAALSCEATFVGLNANGDKFAQFTAHYANDMDITIIDMANSNISLENSKTSKNPLNTKESLILTATKIDQTKKSIINAEVSDAAGNLSNCINAIIVEGKSVKKTYPKIPKKAGDQVILHIQNDYPGITGLKIKVNQIAHTLTLTDGDYQTLDISSDLQNGNANQITFEGDGVANSLAYIIIYGS